MTVDARAGLATGLRCVRCAARAGVAEGVYVCPACGGNLLVEVDLERARRALRREDLARDGDRSIWRFGPLIPVPRLEGPPVGGTPLVDAPRLAARLGVRSLLLKDEGRNPSASLKDRASAAALARARAEGRDLVTVASTGNAAAATAALAAACGMRARIFVPAAAPPAKIAQLLAFGAEVLAVEGTYDEAFDLCLAATRRFGWYNRSTGFNPWTREGKKTVAFEVAEQLGWRAPDLVVVPTGDGNIISGAGKGFAELEALGWIERRPRLLAAQAEGSASIVRALEGDGQIRPSPGRTVADSIAAALPRDGEAAVRAVRDSGGLGVAVPDEEILAAVPELARHSGVFGEPAAACGLAALGEALRRGLVDPAWRVVLLVTGSGLKDVQAVLRAAGEPGRGAAPVRIRPDIEDVARAVGGGA